MNPYIYTTHDTKHTEHATHELWNKCHKNHLTEPLKWQKHQEHQEPFIHIQPKYCETKCTNKMLMNEQTCWHQSM